MSKQAFSRGQRFGRLSSCLDNARSLVGEASAFRDLLSSDDAQRMSDCYNTLVGLHQRCWERSEAEIKRKARK